MNRGRFIVFEGPDGSGKSTQARLLKDHLECRGEDVVLTREPGGTRLGEQARDILLDEGRGPVSLRAELLLYMASRAQLVEEVIVPCLAGGRTVISDRYVYSSVVYQGYAGGLPVEEVTSIGAFATRGLTPDVVFLLDCPAEEGLRRLAGKRDRVESRESAFHVRVREGFLSLARRHPRLFRVVDGTRSPGAVSAEICGYVDRTLL